MSYAPSGRWHVWAFRSKSSSTQWPAPRRRIPRDCHRKRQAWWSTIAPMRLVMNTLFGSGR